MMFYAQYINQKVLSYKNDIGGLRKPSSAHFDNNETFLLLKSLTNITDVEASYIALVVFKNISDISIILIKDGIRNMFESGWNIDGLRMLEIFDYLRASGYAIPYRGYTVDELISMGFVEMK